MILIAFESLAALLALMAIVQGICTWRDSRRFPAPGCIALGSRGKIHVQKLGSGEPAIVLESGISSSSLSWSGFQPMLSSLGTSYSYDRPGLAWSPKSRKRTCSLKDLVEDLHAWMISLEVPAPCILVAHSFGAYIVRAYAQRYPERVAGLVLVDPLAPEEWCNPTPNQCRTLRRGVLFSTIGVWLARFGVVRFSLWLLQRGNTKTPGRVLESFGPAANTAVKRILGEISKFPAEALPLIRSHWSSGRSFATMARYFGALSACTDELLALPPLPPELPVTILTGAHQPEVRIAEHADLADQSHHGRHIVAVRGGHWIQLDEPELLLTEIEEMVLSLREQREAVVSQAVRAHI